MGCDAYTDSKEKAAGLGALIEGGGPGTLQGGIGGGGVVGRRYRVKNRMEHVLMRKTLKGYNVRNHFDSSVRPQEPRADERVLVERGRMSRYHRNGAGENRREGLRLLSSDFVSRRPYRVTDSPHRTRGCTPHSSRSFVSEIPSGSSCKTRSRRLDSAPFSRNDRVWQASTAHGTEDSVFHRCDSMTKMKRAKQRELR